MQLVLHHEQHVPVLYFEGAAKRQRLWEQLNCKACGDGQGCARGDITQVLSFSVKSKRRQTAMS